MNDILYMKIERNNELDHMDVRLGDIAKLECVNASVKNRLKTLLILKFQDKKYDRRVISVMKVIELIHKIYPNLEIQNLGESDFIVEYKSSEDARGHFQIPKVIFLCVVVFFGSAFSIMAFNNDIGVTNLFQQVYTLTMGIPSDGFTVLEWTYSLGIGLGIIVFYNHFGGKRITKDPTPMEVQMYLYEDDVNMTLIEESDREGKSVDVD